MKEREPSGWLPHSSSTPPMRREIIITAGVLGSTPKTKIFPAEAGKIFVMRRHAPPHNIITKKPFRNFFISPPSPLPFPRNPERKMGPVYLRPTGRAKFLPPKVGYFFGQGPWVEFSRKFQNIPNKNLKKSTHGLWLSSLTLDPQNNFMDPRKGGIMIIHNPFSVSIFCTFFYLSLFSCPQKPFLDAAPKPFLLLLLLLISFSSLPPSFIKVFRSQRLLQEKLSAFGYQLSAADS